MNIKYAFLNNFNNNINIQHTILNNLKNILYYFL